MDFLQAFDKYFGVEGILAAAMTAALIYWTTAGIEVGREIYTLLGAAWGFYFSRNGSGVIEAVRRRVGSSGGSSGGGGGSGFGVG